MCPVRTDFNILSPTYSYVDLHIKMSASSTFLCFLLATVLHMVVQTLLSNRAILPTWYMVTHLIHDYRANFHGFVCCGVASATRGELRNIRHIMCFYTLCSCCASPSLPSSSLSSSSLSGVEFPPFPCPNCPCVPRRHVPR